MQKIFVNFPDAIKWFSKVWLLTNRLFLIVPIGAFICMLLYLLLNASHGFGISDEAYYLLWARQPENVLVSASQFGYYTKLLYFLSGENITVFRIFGMVLLLAAAGIFVRAIERYWGILVGSESKTDIRWTTISLTLTGALVYYRSWLLTPSYNWLALICILFVATGLLRIVTNWSQDQQNRRFDSNIITNGLLVGVGGSMAFMAKPTTAIILAFTTLYWLSAHPKKSLWKEFCIISFISASLVILTHAVLLKGGLVQFASELVKSTMLLKILGAGHTLGSISIQAIDDVKTLFHQVFTVSWGAVLSLPIILLTTRWAKRNKLNKSALFILSTCLILITINIGYKLIDLEYWLKFSIGTGGLIFSLILLSLALVTLLSLDNKRVAEQQVSFNRLVIIFVFLSLLAFAYAFGSANGLIGQMSGAYVFFAIGALYIARWIDQYIGQRVLTGTVSTIIAIFSFLALNQGYNHPYGLPESINKQVEKISFVSGRSHLHVDQPTADYINDLKNMANEAGWIPGTPLLDITGGSPGALVILDARILGLPWFPGGRPGSSLFVGNVLAQVPKKLQDQAWILTAPYGRKNIADFKLTDIGLDFPTGYVAAGTTISGHRNEFQVLWRPDNINHRSNSKYSHLKEINPYGYGFNHDYYRKKYQNIDSPLYQISLNYSLIDPDLKDFKMKINKLPFMTLQGIRGGFDIRPINEENDSGLRIVPSHDNHSNDKEWSGKPVLIFGPKAGRNGFEIDKGKGQYYIFSTTIRVSQPNSVQVFIMEKDDKWEKIISRTRHIDGQWHEYFVVKRKNQKSSQMRFGIRWNPEHNGFLDIKDMKVYLSPGYKEI